MKVSYGKGTITVFLSLVSVLFLSLLCTAAESARVQGCRAKAAASLDMGMFSVMGEFERELLDHYDVFFLDGAEGSGVYSKEKISESLRNFMEYNVDPNKGRVFGNFDPFGLTLQETKVTGVTLMTDENGGAFYQQAVSFMKENIGTEVVNTLLERMQQGEELEEAGNNYKTRNDNITKELKELEQKQKEEEQARKEEALENGETPQTEQQEKVKNPLTTIRKLKRKGILTLVAGDDVSEKEISGDRPSKRSLQQGELPVETEHSGLISDFLFQEYLFERFSLYTDAEKEEPLDYALEYILCGKSSDEANLKSVVKRLLLFREGANFLYLSNNEAAFAAAEAFATVLAGILPIPGLVTVTAYALLLAWAYGESLLDVKELLAGGKVPVWKTADTWKLEIHSLANLDTLLENTNGSGTEGLSYAGYLQILFAIGKRSAYPMRALDLIEGYMRSRAATGAFRADNAVCKIEAEADFQIPQLFLRVPAAFLGTGGMQLSYHASGTFGY